MEATYFASSARTLDNLDFCQFSATTVVLILLSIVDFVFSVRLISALQDQQYHRFRLPPQVLKLVHGDPTIVFFGLSTKSAIACRMILRLMAYAWSYV